jgi:hypothetical protein
VNTIAFSSAAQPAIISALVAKMAQALDAMNCG